MSDIRRARGRHSGMAMELGIRTSRAKPVASLALLVRPDLIELLWYNGSRFATLLNGIKVAGGQTITK